MKRYSLIYADPAWSYGNTISNGAAIDHYPTMSLLDMKRLPVWELTADNAVLAMWYTGTHNQEAIEVISGTSFAGLVTDWYPDNRIHECPPSDERANIRSATPLGFARAVFLSNAPHLNKKREAA